MGLVARSLSKRFGAVQALDRVDLHIRPGEVHALVGENGAGKSTLIRILTGTLEPDCGTLGLDGRPVRFRSAHDAARAGIAAVFQELSLVGPLSVAENIFANRQPVNRLNLIRRGALRQQARAMLATFAASLDPDTPVEQLAPAEQQAVEILKALSVHPRVLLLDEPTSSLAQRESEILLRRIRQLRDAGVAVVYISHHLQEVLALADRITVLRDGRRVATVPAHEATEASLVRLMVGRELQDIYGHSGVINRSGTPRLAVRGLSRPGAFEDLDFELWPGEIVGLAGLVGAGRTALGRALGGAAPAARGRILLDGRLVRPTTPHAAVGVGLAYVPEDRRRDGLFLRQSVRDNLVAPQLAAFTTAGCVRDRRIDAFAENCRARYQIVARDAHQTVARLSGGNQQKTLLAAWMEIMPRVLIADEPTRGVDVGARLEIYTHLRQLAARGAAVLLISSDLLEILGLCDRVLVMRAGRLVGEFDRAAATEERVLAAALGTTAGARP